MKFAPIFLVLFAALLTGCGNNAQPIDKSVNMMVREISADPNNVKEMLNEAKSAVVAVKADLSGGYSIGSGVAISEGGYILTNNHVIEGARKVTLYFADKSTSSASVVWAEPGLDIAIIKSEKALPYLATDSLDNVYLGDEVYAIGTPLTLEFKHTITKGIVSANNRTLETESAYGSSFLQSLIQHDASINPGNSGGPLISSEGKVIGINTLKASEGEGIGFAVPVELGKIVVDKLLEDGKYETPYIGIFGFDSDLALAHNVTLSNEGVYVVSVTKQAEKNGLREGDLILSLDGQKISNMLDFRKILLKKSVGEKLNIGLIRNNASKTITVTLNKKG